MFKAVVVLFLGIYLMTLLNYQSRPRTLLKPSRPDKFVPQTARVSFAVLATSWVLATPMALLFPAELEQVKHSGVKALLVVAAPVLAYWLVRRVSPQQRRSKRVLLGAKATGLLAVVVASEMLALNAGIPVLSVTGPLLLIATVATVTYLACMRLVEFGYWPTLLARQGWEHLLTSALLLGMAFWPEGLPDPARADGVTLVLFLLGVASFLTAVVAIVVGHLRQYRWMRSGPPANPAPPGVGCWPPKEGEVWLAIITHDDPQSTYKERPVLVWNTTPSHVDVLTITSQPKHGDNRYLPLNLAQWNSVLTKSSWLSLEIRPVPYAEMLRYMGHCPVNGLGDRLDRKVRTRNRPWPDFTRRHLWASAKNKHVGPHTEAVSTFRYRPPARPRSRTR
ncbi:hypothetical protein [Actinophytocola sp.]|uniref:hypothetical protein n=1 Tax=Actinophytocola sp. TaxID=1872138 RepID=UPI002ED5805B